MTIFWPAGQTPYVTPDQLYSASGATQWPIGLSFGTLPDLSSGYATTDQNQAVLSMLCAQATTDAETIVNQPLRCTLTTEELEGPQFRVTVQWHSRNGRIICDRWPVLGVTDVQVSPNAVFPRSWTPVPAGHYEPEFPVQGLYGTNTAIPGEGGQSIIVAPGYINWDLGREGYRVKITYYAGWPHTCLTASAAAGATSITVDDCTGWAITSGNASTTAAVVYDALGGGQEPVTATKASATAGPGTLTLSAPLAYSHAAGIMVSSMPQQAIWATAMLAGAAALTRGATATTSQTISGHHASAGSGLRKQAAELLGALRKTI